MLTASVEVDHPAEAVWRVLADYGRDPEWRRGVETMAPSPAGEVVVGTTTAEILHLAGRTYHNDGVVLDVQPGERFAWRTTSGADARGSRAVRPLPDGRSEVTLTVAVVPHGFERVLRPVLIPLLRRGLHTDLARLAALLAREGAPSAA